MIVNSAQLLLAAISPLETILAVIVGIMTVSLVVLILQLKKVKAAQQQHSISDDDWSIDPMIIHETTIAELVTSLSHELNNPFHLIQAGYDLLHRDDSDDDTRALAWKAIHQGIVDGKKVLHTIQASRSSLGKSLLTKNDPSRIVSKAIQNAFTLISSKSVNVIQEYASDEHIICNPEQTAVALAELIKNAVEASEVNATIVLRYEILNDAHVFTVRDNGDGMTDEVRKQIFRPFFTTKQGHLGLGLSKSKTLANLHKGTVGLKETSLGGTTLLLSIPRLSMN
ncbi:sensor histidine kinase [Sanyastnella coralliicola]|uniref:sensor histidine kinase n=1 Tax=Sanyastnella coralliicola TaxID=3069118 RepID=UPI0027B96079|nr:HAMP domain-containing sensor histidine kinase [Longitalea sp. SCSIO 12813]